MAATLHSKMTHGLDNHLGIILHFVKETAFTKFMEINNMCKILKIYTELNNINLMQSGTSEHSFATKKTQLIYLILKSDLG